jgi:hypothetical protein
MGNLHVPVIDNIGKVVGGKSIPFDYDKLLGGVAFPGGAVDKIDKARDFVGAEEPDGMRLAFAGAFIRLCWGNATASARVTRSVALLKGYSRVLLQDLGGAEAPVCLAFVQQDLRMLVIEVQSFRLTAMQCQLVSQSLVHSFYILTCL